MTTLTDIPFFYCYCNARNKKHGMGAAPIRQAIMLGFMAQFIAGGWQRSWTMRKVYLFLLWALYVPAKKVKQ